ncbi:MAG: F-box protein [Burkholderiales bacterium]
MLTNTSLIRRVDKRKRAEEELPVSATNGSDSPKVKKQKISQFFVSLKSEPTNFEDPTGESEANAATTTAWFTHQEKDELDLAQGNPYLATETPDKNNRELITYLLFLPDELQLAILKHMTPQDQKQFMLVNKFLYNLVKDNQNLYNPFHNVKLNPKVIEDDIEFNKFCQYLSSAGCQVKTLDLSQIKPTANACSSFSFSKIFQALLKNNYTTSLNITGCELSEAELSSIGEIPHIQTLVITSGLEPEQQKEVLTAKAENRDARLHYALKSGNKGLVSVWVKVILNSDLAKQDKIELLHAQDAAGSPGLNIALDNGCTEAIKAFIIATLASSLSNEEKVELLHAQDAAGFPGLNIALDNGRTEAVEEFIIAILASSLSNEKKFELLNTKDADGSPGLYLALSNGYTEATKAFITAILASSLSNEEKFELLSAKNANGSPGLHIALQYGHTEVTTVFITAILASSLSNGEKFELLSATITQVMRELSIALQNGYAEEIINLINQLSRELEAGATKISED